MDLGDIVLLQFSHIICPSSLLKIKTWLIPSGPAFNNSHYDTQSPETFPMPTISNLKKSVISALRKNPDEGSKPQLKRRVIPFDEAFSNLKTSKSGVVICVAFHSFGKCRKEIALPDSDFFANLGQLNMADVQTPIKLMPLMLCSSHWKKTIYYNLLFLDWLSTYGLKQDNQHYESIVVDYQSAVAIHDQQASVSSIPMSLEPLAEDLARLAAENNASTDSELFSSFRYGLQAVFDWNFQSGI
jgi:hypothetical protein